MTNGNTLKKKKKKITTNFSEADTDHEELLNDKGHKYVFYIKKTKMQLAYSLSFEANM